MASAVDSPTEVGREGIFHLDLKAATPRLRPLLGLTQPLVERALGLREMARLHSMMAGPAGGEFIDRALRVFDVRVDVERADLGRIPTEGPLVVVANHPFGGIEGLVLAKLLLARRSDVRVMANYFLGRIPELRQLFLLVDPFGGPRAVRANLGAMRRALRWLGDGGVLALFPAGEVSHLNLRRRLVEDPRWLDTVEGLVRHARCTVLPVYFPGRNSWGFQAAGLIHPRMRTALLGRELLRRRGGTIEARIGSPIPWRQLATHTTPAARTAYLRSRTYILSERPSVAAGAMQPRLTPRRVHPLGTPTPDRLIVDEIERLPSESLLLDAGQDLVYVAAAPEIPNLLREIGRQRERTFREVGEGTGRDLDLDLFDRSYHHLFVWNRERRELVGAYRIGLTDELLGGGDTDGLYTSTLFDYRPQLFDAMGPGLEMGRSFIRPEYQKSYTALLLLWKGIGQLVLRHPDNATLFGPVSISADYRSASQRLIVAFLEQNKFAHDWSRWVRPRTPIRPGRSRGFRLAPGQLQNLEQVSSFIAEIEADQKGVPILLRQYLKLGGRLLGFNVDPDFSNVLDVLIMVDLRQTAPKILARYMGREGAARFQAHHARHAPRAG